MTDKSTQRNLFDNQLLIVDERVTPVIGDWLWDEAVERITVSSETQIANIVGNIYDKILQDDS